MPKPRESGDQLESALCGLFDSMKISCTTPEKRDKLISRFGGTETNINKDVLSKAVSKILPELPTHFYMTTDSDGKHGITSDVYVCSDTLSIGISCKRNNISVKHQRPRALIQHLALPKEIELQYKKEYDAFIGDFHNTCCGSDNHTMFRQVSATLKSKLYSDINALACKYVTDAPNDNKLNLIRFILSANESNSYVLHYNDKRKSCKMCQLAKSVDTIETFAVTCRLTNYLDIECNGIQFSLRIHNASSRRTKEVSLKYDTKLLNYDDVFRQVE